MNKDKLKTFSKIIIVLCAFFALCAATLLIPFVREMIISEAEKIIGRMLTHSAWHGRMIKCALYFIAADCVVIAFVFVYVFCPYFRFLSECSGIFNISDSVKGIIKSPKQLTVIILVFVMLIGIRLFYIGQKKSLHVDECLSISVCNRNVYGFWGDNYEINSEYRGKELKDISFWDNDSVQDALSDVLHMYIDNRDSPHTNLYYSLFRLWFTGVKTANLNYIIWRGCFLNVVFFIISFFFMILLIRRWTDNLITVCFCLLIAFLNPTGLSLTVFMRPYELQQMCIIILTYYVTCCYQAKQSGVDIETLKNFIIGIFVLAFAMLSAYFSLIVISIYGLCLILQSLFHKDYRQLVFFVFMFLMSIIAAKLLYLGFGAGFSGNRGSESMANLSIGNLKITAIAFINGINMLFLSGNIFLAIYYIGIFALFILTLLFGHRNESNRSLNAILIAITCSIFVIIWFAPVDLKSLRHVAPLFPILSLYFICFKNKIYLNYIASTVSLLIIVFSLIPFRWTSHSVEHLDDAHVADYRDIQENQNTIFICGTSNWKYGMLIPYLKDDNTVIFIDDINEITAKYFDKIPCALIIENEDRSINKYNTDNITIEKRQTLSYYDVYVITSKFSI